MTFDTISTRANRRQIRTKLTRDLLLGYDDAGNQGLGIESVLLGNIMESIEQEEEKDFYNEVGTGVVNNGILQYLWP